MKEKCRKNRKLLRVKSKMKKKLYYWLSRHDLMTVSAAISGCLVLIVSGSVALFIFSACKQMGTNDRNIGKEMVASGTLCNTRYRRPDIPQMMTDPQQRAFYYVKHYWDEYSLADTAFIHGTDTEQLFADFIDALKYVSPQESETALRNMMNLMEADSTAYIHFCFLSEKYLHAPNSPMRNEDYYIPVLEQVMLSKKLSEVDKIRPADQLKQAKKNRPGMTATDFSYVTPKGKAGRMSGIKADYTMLFFYDPDCSNCREYEHILSEIPAFLEMQEKGTLRVLAVYPDEDENEWLLKSSQMPRNWIVGWNKQGDIRSKMLYEIRATPTLFLLDKQKKVILKDATLDQIIRYLAMSQQGQQENQ